VDVITLILSDSVSVIMSKGLGAVESLILNEISLQGYCLLKDFSKRSAVLQPSVFRAAQSLQRKNLITVRAFMMQVGDLRVNNVGRGRMRSDIYDEWKNTTVDDGVSHKVTAAFPYGLSDDEINEIRGKNKLGEKDFIEYMRLSPSKRKKYDIEFEKRAKEIAGLIKWYDV